MKKQELRGAFSQMRAPDPCVEKVLAAQDGRETAKRRNVARRIVAAAAALALLVTGWLFWPVDEDSYVTAPGLLVVRAYAVNNPIISEENSMILEEGVTLPWEYGYDSGTNVVAHGMPLFLSVSQDIYEGMEITFECFVSGAYLYQDVDLLIDENGAIDGFHYWSTSYLGNHCKINTNHTIYWSPYDRKFDYDKREVISVPGRFQEDRDFVDIIIRADDYIVGYAVIEIFADPEYSGNRPGCNDRYYARLLETVSFPPVEGKWQDISKAYVKGEFQQIHETVMQ
jgi:hypothetical protein